MHHYNSVYCPSKSQLAMTLIVSITTVVVRIQGVANYTTIRSRAYMRAHPKQATPDEATCSWDKASSSVTHQRVKNTGGKR